MLRYRGRKSAEMARAVGEAWRDRSRGTGARAAPGAQQGFQGEPWQQPSGLFILHQYKAV